MLVTSQALRDEANRARFYAHCIRDAPAAERLRQYAADLEAQAAALEQNAG
jgi:hypothetical protein